MANMLYLSREIQLPQTWYISILDMKKSICIVPSNMTTYSRGQFDTRRHSTSTAWVSVKWEISWRSVSWTFHCFSSLLNTSCTFHIAKNNGRDGCGKKQDSLTPHSQSSESISIQASVCAQEHVPEAHMSLVCKICMLIFFLKGHKFVLFSTLCKANNTPLVQNKWSATVL